MPLQYTYNPDGSVKSVVSVNPDGTPKVAAGDEYPMIIKYREDGSIKSAVGQQKPPGYVSSYTPLPVLGSESKMSNIPTTFGNILNSLIGADMDDILSQYAGSAMTELDRAQLENIPELMHQVGSDGFVDAMGNDLITGQRGRRSIDDFEKHIKLNKNAFIKNQGLPGEKGSGMQGFNKYIDQLQSGVIGKLTEGEAKFLDDLKNNRINF
jgi:hypothetical protein